MQLQQKGLPTISISTGMKDTMKCDISGTFVVHVHNFRQNYKCDPSSLHHTLTELSQFDSQFYYTITEHLELLFVMGFFCLETLQLQ